MLPCLDSKLKCSQRHPVGLNISYNNAHFARNRGQKAADPLKKLS